MNSLLVTDTFTPALLGHNVTAHIAEVTREYARRLVARIPFDVAVEPLNSDKIGTILTIEILPNGRSSRLDGAQDLLWVCPASGRCFYIGISFPEL